MKSFFKKNEERVFKGLLVFSSVSILFSGAASIINEFILATISSQILGNTFKEMALTIGIMLLGTALGAIYQRRISDNGLLIKFIKLEITLTLVGAFSPSFIYWLFGNAQAQFAIFLDGSIFFLGFLIGFEISLLIRILQRYSPDLKGNLSLIFSSDYLGAFAGSLIWVYFLILYFPLTESSFIVSLANFTVATMTFFYFYINKEKLADYAYTKEKLVKEVEINTLEFLKKDPSFEKKELRDIEREDTKISLFRYSLTFLIVISLLLYGYANNRKWSFDSEQKMYKDIIIDKVRTPYQNVVMTKNKKLDQIDIFINGNIQFSSLDEHIYHDALIHPMMATYPMMGADTNKTINALIIGGGDGMAARELFKYKNVKVTLIDLDKDWIQFARNNEILKKLNGDAFKNINIVDSNAIDSGEIEELKDDQNETYAIIDLINIDAEKFLRDISHKQWDIVVIDLPDPSNPELVKLYSKQFYTSLKKILSDDGMFVVQSTSPYHAKEAFLCIGRTLEAAGLKTIPYHVNVHSFGDWGYYMGWKNEKTKEEVLSKINSVNSLAIDTRYITPEVMKASLVFGKGTLKTSRTEINEILYPKLLDIYTNNSWLTY